MFKRLEYIPLIPLRIEEEYDELLLIGSRAKAIRNDEKGVWVIAKSDSLESEDDDKWVKQVRAYFNLFKAAPDLLAALEELKNPQHFRADPTVETLRARDKALTKARAAIAKARG